MTGTIQFLGQGGGSEGTGSNYSIAPRSSFKLVTSGIDGPLRVGSVRVTPAGAGGLIDHVNSPEFATAVGLVMYAHRNHAQQPRGANGGPLARVAVRIKGFFHGFLGQ